MLYKTTHPRSILAQKIDRFLSTNRLSEKRKFPNFRPENCVKEHKRRKVHESDGLCETLKGVFYSKNTRGKLDKTKAGKEKQDVVQKHQNTCQKSDLMSVVTGSSK
jgi:hypothetical protein